MDFQQVHEAACLLPGSNTDDPCDDNFTLAQCEDPLYAYQHQSECPDWSDIEQLEVRPTDGGTVAVSKSYQFRAFLIFEDGREKDVTSLATWSIGNSSVATVSDEDDDKGTVTGVSVGATTVFATYLGNPGNAAVDVVADCETTGVDFVLVFDQSGSMNAEGADGKTRMAKTLEAARNFVLQADLTVDQISVIGFTGRFHQIAQQAATKERVVTVYTGLTSDLDTILDAIDAVDPVDWDNHCFRWGDTLRNWTSYCATGIGGGLEAAYDELNSARHNATSRRTIILLSDGMENICDPDPVEIAATITGDGIAIAVIALALPNGPATDCDGAAVGSTSAYLESLTTCDLFFEADTVEDLPDVYSQIPRLVCEAIAAEDPCVFYSQ